MFCKEPISHVGKCQHLFKHAGMFFVSQGKIPTAVPPADTRQCTAPGRVCATQHCVSVPHSPSLPWWSLQVQEEYMLNTQPLSAAWCSVLVSLLGIDMHIERFQTVREQVEGTGYPYKGGNSKFWALLHFVSVSLLRTQWTCVLQVFLFKSLVRATYPAVRLKTIPTNPLWLVIDFSLFFFDLKSCCHRMIHHSDYETTVFWEVSLFLATPGNLLAWGWGLFAHLFQVILWDFIEKDSLVLLLPEATYVGISDFPVGLSRTLLYLCR